jgi:hypothetical protein
MGTSISRLYSGSHRKLWRGRNVLGTVATLQRGARD